MVRLLGKVQVRYGSAEGGHKTRGPRGRVWLGVARKAGIGAEGWDWCVRLGVGRKAGSRA